MDEQIVVGIDIGTTKVCTLVARVEGERSIRILGVGIEPSRASVKAHIVDLPAASQAIARSVEKAERSSGLEITAALVSLAGSQCLSVNSKGVVGISGGVIEAERCRPRPGCRPGRGHPSQPRNHPRHPARLHRGRAGRHPHARSACTVTAWKWKRTSSPPLQPPSKTCARCVQAAGVEVTQFVLNPLASAEVVLTETERADGRGGHATSAAGRPTWRSTSTAMSGTPWCWPSAATTSPADIAHGLAPAPAPGRGSQETARPRHQS